MNLRLKDLDRREYLLQGHSACPGCPAALGLRLLGKALGSDIVLVVPAGCLTMIQGAFPKTSVDIPLLNIAFAASAATASGVAAAFEIKKKNIPVVVYAGDGGTVDIGIQSLSGAAERGDNILYVCYDNEAYENTGVQRSGATPYGAWTTTSIKGKSEKKKDMPSIIVAHGIPYVATASVAYPLDFIEKTRKAVKLHGTKYIHLHSPCPTGWRFSSEKMVEIGRKAVLTGSWILYEVMDGHWRLTGPSRNLVDKRRRKPIEEYLRAQGRFAHVDQQMLEVISEQIDQQWKEVEEKIK
ncbi:MAG: pyruvate synthase subunit PorB [Nitrososphaeria archaeon]